MFEMSRLEFVLWICGVALALEFLSWCLGFGFDHHWITANFILVPMCAFLMPNRKDDKEGE